jgi:outer membrane protein OmpA-like peptidoglycan-associated protein
MKKSTLALVMASAFLAACTTDPFTGEQKPSNAIVGAGAGAGIGALGGAILGAAVGADARKAAMIGAGVGLLTGTGIGLYMDNQEAKLRNQLQGTGVSITRMGDSIVLNMPSNITFDTDQADVKSQFFATLNSVDIVFREYKQTLINVVGHTDSTGDANQNYDLSRRRAAAVAQYLSAQQLDPHRFSVEGHGANDPIASNASPSGRAQNRRVEITILPLT